MSIYQLVRKSFRGLYLPLFFSAAVAVGLSKAFHFSRWPELVGACVVIGAAYAGTFYFWGARAEERALAQQMIRLPILALRASIRMFRGLFHRSDSISG